MQSAERSEAQGTTETETYFRGLLKKMYALLATRGLYGSDADDLVAQSVIEVVRALGTRSIDLASCESAAFRRLQLRWIDVRRRETAQAARRSVVGHRAEVLEPDASIATSREEDRALVRRIFDRVPPDLRPLASLWKTRIDDAGLAEHLRCTVPELQALKKRLIRVLQRIVREERIDVAGLLSSLGD
jgi:DNA-directed RNA polymerase specialized sigma24 family protein